jgi:hypothetical protein
MTSIRLHRLRSHLLVAAGLLAAGLVASLSPLAARDTSTPAGSIQEPAAQDPTPEQEMVEARVLGAVRSLGQGSTEGLLGKLETLLADPGFGAADRLPLLAARYRVLLRAGRLDEARATLAEMSRSGTDAWKAWVRTRGAELDERTGPQDPEVPERLRELIRTAGSLDSGSDQAQMRLVAIGAPATPAILDVIDEFDVGGVEKLIRVLAQIADDRAVEWFEARLREEDDAVFAGLIADNLRYLPVSARNRVARIGLDSDNRTVRWRALTAYEGPADERVFAVADEVLHESTSRTLASSLEVLAKLDPSDERTERWFQDVMRSDPRQQLHAQVLVSFLEGYLEDDASFVSYCATLIEMDEQIRFAALSSLKRRDLQTDNALIRSTYESLRGSAREWFLDALASESYSMPNLTDSATQVIDAILEDPERAIRIWHAVDGATKERHRDVVREAIARYSSNLNAPGGLQQMIQDAGTYGWTELVPTLLEALGSSPGSAAAAAETALVRLAPRQLLLWQLDRGDEVGNELLASATHDDLPVMVQRFENRGDLSKGSVQRLVARILELAGHEDLELVAPLLVVEQNTLNALSIDFYVRAWLDRNLRPEHVQPLLAKAPLGDQIIYRITSLVRPEDREALADALVRQTESTTEARPAELEQLASALLKLGGSENLLLDLASREVGVLRALGRSDIDRRSVWASWLQRGLTEPVWRAALRDTQVSADSELARMALDRAELWWIGNTDTRERDAFNAFIARLEGSIGIDFCRGLLEPIDEGRVLDLQETWAASAALQALGQFRDPALLPTLAKALHARTEDDNRYPLSRAVVPELVRTFSIEAVPYLIDAMKSDDTETADAAKKGLDRLKRVLEEEREWRLMQQGLLPTGGSGDGK